MSITSMNARMGMAEKLSIPQLTKAVQDGTVPSFIGIPLIQQKMKEQQGAASMQPQQPPVAQQVLQQAMATEGVQALPSNMPQEYAQGGILHYADGGDIYDDEDYDPEDEAQAYALSQGEDLMDQLVSSPDMYEYSSGPGIESLREVKSSPSGKSFEAKEAKVQVGDGTSEKLLKHILHKESRGQRYDKEGNLLTSSKGALGEMQVMPATARDPGFGIAPARSNDPDELRRVGEEYARVLLNKYRDPKLAAIAYNMGPGNTDKWLAAGADISKLPQETRGYVQGMAGGGAVHFDGGGITDVFNMTPDEVKEYAKRKLRLEQLKSAFGSAPASAAPVATGTGIAPAAAPSFVESAKNALGRLNPRGLVGYGSLFHTEDLNQGEQAELDKRWKQAYESPAETARLLRQNATATGTPIGQVAAPQAAPSAPRMPDTTADNIDMGGGQNFGATQAAAQAAPAEQAVQANPMFGIEELLNKREAGLGRQKDIDNYMSLLSAGLGMMGGTSPFAAANIGQGAQAGIKTYGDAAARRVAEENAILSGRLGAYKYAGSRAQADAMMALRKDLQNQQLGYNRERLAQTGKEHEATLSQRKEAKQLDLIKNEQDRALATAAKLVGDNPAALSMSDTQKAEAVRKMADSLLMQNKMYRTSHVNVYGADPFAEMGGGGGGTRLKFDAQGQQIK